MAETIPSINDVSWQGICAREQYLAQQGAPELRAFYAARVAVMQPTIAALNGHPGGPPVVPPVVVGAVVPPDNVPIIPKVEAKVEVPDNIPDPDKFSVKTVTTGGTVTNGAVNYADDWHTVRFSNTTNESITVVITLGANDALPTGGKVTGPHTVEFTIEPGKYVDITFAPESHPNFKSTKGDGSVWNQGELYFDEKTHTIWGDMSYIYGANSNMRIYSQDGQHSGYQGDLFANVPEAARVGNWGIVAPYDRFHPSDDPNNPDSAAGGPNGPKNAGATYLYGIIPQGEGYVDRGKPIEVSEYDDASSLGFKGNVAIVF